jgi:hypothetical protein
MFLSYLSEYLKESKYLFMSSMLAFLFAFIVLGHHTHETCYDALLTLRLFKQESACKRNFALEQLAYGTG